MVLGKIYPQPDIRECPGEAVLFSQEKSEEEHYNLIISILLTGKRYDKKEKLVYNMYGSL